MRTSMKWFICVGILLVKFKAFHALCPPPHLYPTVEAKLCQNNTDYHCLYDGRTKSSQSHCFKAEIYIAGSYVLYEGGLNAKPCPVNRYQPVPYMSNQYHECAYTKSACSEEGQVVYDYDSTERDPTENDRPCRCDYRTGYDFVSKPKHKCFCIPSEEDCSCILKHCPDNVKRLTPDYECLTNIGLITCPVIPSKHDTDREKGEGKQKGMFQYNDNTYNVVLKAGTKKFVICGAIAVLDVVLIFIVISSNFLPVPSQDYCCSCYVGSWFCSLPVSRTLGLESFFATKQNLDNVVKWLHWKVQTLLTALATGDALMF